MEIEIINDFQRYKIFEPAWIKSAHTCCDIIGLKDGYINIILITDDALKKMHNEYLEDDNYTDVMTFDLGEPDAPEAEIYISPGQAEINSTMYNNTVEIEIMRLIVHGCLHLAGYDDLDRDNRKIMKNKENEIVETIANHFENF